MITSYDELYHYGVKRRSGRYPYGSGDRPFQGESGRSSRPKRQSALSRAIQARKERKAAEEKAKKAAADKKAAEEAAQKEANKERVLRSGRASEVLQYQGELSNAELNAVWQRLNWERSIKELSQKEHQDIWKKIDTITKQMGTLANALESGNKIYSQVQKLLDNLSKERGNG